MTTEIEPVNRETGEVSPAVQTINLFGASDAVKVIEQASAVAVALARVIEQQKLYSNIQGKKYVRVEGWTLLGSMLGVFPVCTWTRRVEDGWEARVEARTLSGALVGAAEAECLTSEKNWGDRDDYALRSMAQTRATSKALRLPLGFVVTMAGFEGTPSEEVPPGGFTQSGDRKAPFGMCAAHKQPFLQSEAQKRAGRPPSHPIRGTQPVEWCERPLPSTTTPPTDAESLQWDPDAVTRGRPA